MRVRAVLGVKHLEMVIAYVGVQVRAGEYLGGRIRACYRWLIRIPGSRVLAEPRAKSPRPVDARGRPVTSVLYLCCSKLQIVWLAF
jgi:hypothetical protein